MTRLLSLAALAIPLLACLTGNEPPGEYYGTYEITGVLTENECGAAVPALNPFTFRVELRTDGGAALWRRPEAPLSYGIVREGVWEIDSAATLPVYEADPTTGMLGCALTQAESIVLEELVADQDAAIPDGGGGDAGEEMGDALTMQGTTTITYTPTAGSDCSPSLVTFGGPFDALPCALHYELSVVPTESIF